MLSRTASNHFGLSYRDPGEFLRNAAGFAADGLRNNHRLAYVGDGAAAELHAELSTMPGVAEHLDSDAVQVIPAIEFYVLRRGEVVDAEATLDRYIDGVQRATADGYAGLRALVDVTPVARTGKQRAAMARLEYLGDKETTMRPFSALCGYDAARLGPGADELICLHPRVSNSRVSFRLYTDPATEADLVLAGEIDAASSQLFAHTMQRIWEFAPGHTVSIDATGLEFISHRQLLLLQQSAWAHNRKAVLWTGQPILHRLAGLLELTRIDVREAP